MNRAQPSPDFLNWIHSRLGYVVGNDGRGGSGICIQLADGSDAILTARHVVIDCILTGSISVARVGDKQMVFPKRIRISSRTDAAYIISSDPNPPTAKLSFAGWTTPPVNLSAGLSVFPSGVPGSWKRVDEEKNAIPYVKALVYGTTLANPPRQGNFIICNVNEHVPQLPKTFGGMSGGALFTSDKKFLGVIVSEARNIGGSGHGKIQVVPVQDLDELYGPIQLPLPDHLKLKVSAVFPVVHQQDPKRKSQLEVQGDLHWSQGQPQFSFGRIQMIRFLTPPGAELLYINVESLFFPNEDTDAGRKQAFDEALRFLLSDLGWGIEGQAPL